MHATPAALSGKKNSMNLAMTGLGKWLGAWLNRRRPLCSTSPPTGLARLSASLRPGDVLLVEGDTRVSVAIKYLTQSTWSHAALFVGDALGDASSRGLLEADLQAGVRAVGIAQYADLHCRICRPVGLSEREIADVIDYACARLGARYDLRNVIDLARYLLPTPPVPVRWRRRMIAFGSGDPTRAICSTLIAEAFQSVRYPILPKIELRPSGKDDPLGSAREILHVRHHSLFTPRDFDVSPYFQIIKPTLNRGFDPHALEWSNAEVPPWQLNARCN